MADFIIKSYFLGIASQFCILYHNYIEWYTFWSSTLLVEAWFCWSVSEKSNYFWILYCCCMIYGNRWRMRCWSNYKAIYHSILCLPSSGMHKARAPNLDGWVIDNIKQKLGPPRASFCWWLSYNRTKPKCIQWLSTGILKVVLTCLQTMQMSFAIKLKMWCQLGDVLDVILSQLFILICIDSWLNIKPSCHTCMVSPRFTKLIFHWDL